MPNEQQVQLPESELAKLKEQITNHVKALNASGRLQVDESNIPTSLILQVLGIKEAKAAGSAEEWLCDCDSKCAGHI